MSAQPAPKTARLVGGLFILLLVLGPFCLLWVPSVTFAPGDVARTTALLSENTMALRLGLLAELAIAFIEVAMMLALWQLLRGVSDGLLQASLIARGIMVAVMGVSMIAGLAALTAIARGGAPDVLMMLMESRGAVQQVWGAFFGLHLLLLMPVMLRSNLVPRPLALLLTLAGFGYTLGATGPLIAPAITELAEQTAAIGAFLGEVPLFLWLAARGVPPTSGLATG